MKKSFWVVLLILVGCFLFYLNKSEPEELRIRVISNSNSSEDIAYKGKVVAYLKEEILAGKELSDAYFEASYKAIEKELNKQFENITVEYRNHTFVNKTYNDNALENATYKTLLVYIGEHQGPNWWGSIFDGCITMESTEEVEYEWFINKSR